MTPHSPSDYGSLFSSILLSPRVSSLHTFLGEADWHTILITRDIYGRMQHFEGHGPSPYYAALTAKSLHDDFIPSPPDFSAVTNFAKPTPSGIALLAELGLNKPPAPSQGIKLGARS